MGRTNQMSMNPNIGIKSFMKPQKQAYPTCYVCGKAVRFPSKCDNCGNVVCNRHRPAFVKPWYCSKCLSMWSDWAKNNPDQSSGQTVVEQAVTAETLYAEQRVVEAEKLVTDIFDDLMKDVRQGESNTNIEIINTTPTEKQ